MANASAAEAQNASNAKGRKRWGRASAPRLCQSAGFAHPFEEGHVEETKGIGWVGQEQGREDARREALLAVQHERAEQAQVIEHDKNQPERKGQAGRLAALLGDHAEAGAKRDKDRAQQDRAAAQRRQGRPAIAARAAQDGDQQAGAAVAHQDRQGQDRQVSEELADGHLPAGHRVAEQQQQSAPLALADDAS